MATELIVRTTLSDIVPIGAPILAPVTPHDADLLSRLGLKREFRAKLHSGKSRSLQQNKFYWALLGKVIENHPFYRRGEQLHIWLKLRLGYVEEIYFHDGRLYTHVSSTAFHAMPSDEFKVYLDHVLLVICEEVIPGLRRNALVDEVERMIGVSYEALWIDDAPSIAPSELERTAERVR